MRSFSFCVWECEWVVCPCVCIYLVWVRNLCTLEAFVRELVCSSVECVCQWVCMCETPMHVRSMSYCACMQMSHVCLDFHLWCESVGTHTCAYIHHRLSLKHITHVCHACTYKYPTFSPMHWYRFTHMHNTSVRRELSQPLTQGYLRLKTRCIWPDGPSLGVRVGVWCPDRLHSRARSLRGWWKCQTVSFFLFVCLCDWWKCQTISFVFFAVFICLSVCLCDW